MNMSGQKPVSSNLRAFLGRRPLWQQLAMLALATALPLLLASVIMFNRVVQNERDSIRQGLMVNAKTLAGLVDNEINTHAAIASTLARSPALLSGDLQAFWSEAKDALEFVPGSWLHVVTPDGKMVLSTLRPYGAALPASAQPDLVARAFAERKTQVGNIVTGPVTAEKIAFIETPVFKDGKPLYALSISLVPSRFLAIMQDKYTRGEVVGILDGNMKFVARIPDHGNRIGTLASEGWRAAIARTPEGWTENKTLEGEWSLTGYAATSEGWNVGVAQLESAIQSPLREIFWSSLAGFAVLSALSLLLATAIAQNASRGMRAVAAAAREVGEGKRVDELPVPFAEAATVSQTLASASAELEARGAALTRANSELEAKVAERTAELEAELHRREAAEATLRQVQKIESIGQLTGGIAHDFNNMLTIIMGNLDTIKRRLPKIEQASQIAKPVDSALQGARNAAKLTQRLLAFARRQPLDPVALDLNGLISGISNMLVRTVGEQAKVETVLSAGLWTAFADANQIESALINLAVNARDAMPEGGKLTIETANAYLDEAYTSRFGDLTPGQYVMLSVSDTGTGIAPDKMERIFEPFFTTKEPGKGTGLGLAMVHGFVKQSGGHVRVYSEVGHGTTVKLYLPRYDGHQTALTAPQGKSLANADMTPRASSGETVLLVEDDEGVRDYAEGVLKELGYRVVIAVNGEAALSALETAKNVDIVFTDVVLGGSINGRELADAIKLMKPELPILFTTGYTRNAIVHHGRLDPGVNLLGKPYTQRDMAEKIRSLIDGRKAQQIG
jgi:signal transduction histidine kinase/ActR/RegA family two-component response regulator